MAAVTDGSNPGRIPEGTECDDCMATAKFHLVPSKDADGKDCETIVYDSPIALAKHRVLVEHDSMGNEYADMCDTCYQSHSLARAKERKEFLANLGTCPFCRRRPATTTTFDPDEPQGERVPICGPCNDAQLERFQQETDFTCL